MRTVNCNPESVLAARLLPLSVFFWAALISPTSGVAQPGQLDKTFSKSGIFLGANAGFATATGTAIAIQSDGEIVIAGQTPTQRAGVFRLTANGTLDTSFGTGGFSAIPLAPNSGAFGFLATGVVIQPDGKIVLAISSALADALPVLELARFDHKGNVDPSFGRNGTMLLVRGGPNSSFAAQQLDGKLLVGGSTLLARIDANGNLDSGFGTRGIAPLFSTATAIALQPDGRLVLGTCRYDANGTLDASFGSLGRAASIESIFVARLQTDGKIVGIGSLPVRVSLSQLPALDIVTGFGVMRFTSTGAVDTAFGQEGAAITDFGDVGVTAIPSDVAIQSNGDIIVAGQASQSAISATIPGPAVFAIARYTANGQLDPTFGSGGKVITSLGTNVTAGISAIALDTNGRLIAVGNVSSNGNGPGNLVVARYLTK